MISKSLTVYQRTGRHDVPRSLADHLFGLAADGEDLSGPLVYRHDRRLVYHDAFVLHIDQRIRRSEVDTDIMRKMPEKPLDETFLEIMEPSLDV